MNTLEKDIAARLIGKNLTVSTAESCSGGLIAHGLTNIPGSSKYFKLGVVAYSNEVKKTILNVSKAIIKNKGAVSKEVAISLSKGILKLSKTNIALATTGIAGPGGATKTKPIGLVFIALAYKNKIICRRYHFKGTRLSIKKQTSEAALKLLKNFLKEL